MLSGCVGPCWLGQDRPVVAFFLLSARGEDRSQQSYTLTQHTKTRSGSDKLQMGLGFTTAFLINTMKSIKILTQYVRENENWKGKKLTVHKEYEHSNTEGLTLRQCICKRNSCNMKVQNGNCMGKEGAVESNQNVKQTLSVKFSPASNRCHIRSCEQVCLTTTPAA